MSEPVNQSRCPASADFPCHTFKAEVNQWRDLAGNDWILTHFLTKNMFQNSGVSLRNRQTTLHPSPCEQLAPLRLLQRLERVISGTVGWPLGRGVTLLVLLPRYRLPWSYSVILCDPPSPLPPPGSWQGDTVLPLVCKLNQESAPLLHSRLTYCRCVCGLVWTHGPVGGTNTAPFRRHFRSPFLVCSAKESCKSRL